MVLHQLVTLHNLIGGFESGFFLTVALPAPIGSVSVRPLCIFVASGSAWRTLLTLIAAMLARHDWCGVAVAETTGCRLKKIRSSKC